MKLSEANGKNVTITLTDGKKYSGIAYDYTSQEDNEPEPASITIDRTELFETQIQSIVLN